jgi:hypothetical protein
VAAFDTLAASKRFRDAGFEQQQAEALASALREIASPIDTSALATKADLEAGLAGLKADTKADLAELKAELINKLYTVVFSAVIFNAIVVVGAMLGLVKMMAK